MTQYIYSRKTWAITSKIIKKIPQSYLIETNKGIFKRNLLHTLLDWRRNSYKSRIDDSNYNY